jgi:hypothetical protein
MSSSIRGLSKRRLYKPERAPARKAGVLYNSAPISMPDATAGEVAKAIFALAQEAGVIVGQGSGYDSLKDVYTVVGKSRATGKAQDWQVEGAVVAEVIGLARMLNGGRMATKAERRAPKLKRMV